MFIRFRRKKCALIKDDYQRVKGSTLDLSELGKDGLRFMAKARPDLVVAVPRYTLICELRESFRNQDKKPRHKTISSFSINEEYLNGRKSNKCYPREKVWLSIDRKLSDLNLSSEEEKKIRTTIESRIPRPTKSQLEEETLRLVNALR